MSDVQTARFGRYLQSLFNLKQLHTLGEILPDAIPVIDLEQPRPENELFLGNDLCMGKGTDTGGALLYAQVGCGFNTTPSANALGSVIIIEEVFVSVSVAQEVGLSYGSMSALASAGSASKLDTRRFQQAPLGTVRFDNDAAAAPTAFWAQVVPADQTLSIKGPFVLSQVVGSFERAGLIVSCGTAATTLRASFRWRERALQPSDLL